ncbi:hypothetical protein D3C71_1210740 [compost metagenome]
MTSDVECNLANVVLRNRVVTGVLNHSINTVHRGKLFGFTVVFGCGLCWVNHLCCGFRNTHNVIDETTNISTTADLCHTLVTRRIQELLITNDLVLEWAIDDATILVGQILDFNNKRSNTAVCDVIGFLQRLVDLLGYAFHYFFDFAFSLIEVNLNRHFDQVKLVEVTDLIITDSFDYMFTTGGVQIRCELCHE